MSRTFGSAFVMTSLGNAVLMVLGVLTGIISARYLGPEGRGDLAVIFYFPALLAQVGSLGIEQAASFRASTESGNTGQILWGGVWFALLIGSIQCLIGIFILPFILPSAKQHLIGIAQIFMIFPLVTYVGSAMLGADQGELRFFQYNILRVLPSIFYPAFIVLVVILWIPSATSFALCALAGHLLAMSMRLSFAIRTWSICLPSRLQLAAFFRMGVLFHLPQIAGILLGKADMLLAVSLLSAKDVGLYVVALSIAEASMAAVRALSQVGFVKIARGTDPASRLSALLFQFRVAQLLALGTTGFAIILAPYIIQYAFGESFMPSLANAYWLVVGAGIASLGGVLESGLRAMGIFWAGIVSSCAGLIILVGGALLFLPEGGRDSLAKIMVVVPCVTLLVLCFLVRILKEVSLRDLWGLKRETVSDVMESVERLWRNARSAVC